MDLYFYLSKFLAPIVNVINLFFFLTFILLLIFFFNKNKTILKVVFFLIIFLFAISFFPVGNYLLKSLEKDYFNTNLPDEINYIVVLGGSEDIIKTQLYKKLHLGESSGRLVASIKLSKLYNKAKIIHVGGIRNINKYNLLSESDLAREFYDTVNFDLSKIYFINESRNTYEGIKNLKKYIINHSGQKKILIISSAFHLKRISLIAKKVGLDFVPYAVDFKTNLNIISDKKFSLFNEWQDLDVLSNLKYFNIFFKEIIGILAIYLFFNFT